MTLRHTSFVRFWFRLITLLLFPGMIIKLKQTPRNYPSALFLKYISYLLNGFSSWCLNLEAIAHESTLP